MRVIVKSTVQKAYAKELIEKLNYDNIHVVDINPYSPDRSLEQNNLLHAWCLDASKSRRETTGEYFTPSAWKIHFKSLFLGYETIKTPNGAIDQLRSTKKLGVKKFAEFLTNIEHYCGEHQIKLRDPADYNFIMGRK